MWLSLLQGWEGGQPLGCYAGVTDCHDTLGPEKTDQPYLRLLCPLQGRELRLESQPEGN